MLFRSGITDSEGGAIGGKFGKMYSGYYLRYYHENDATMLTNYITSLAKEGKADAIGFIFTFPDSFIKYVMPSITSGTNLYNTTQDFSRTFSVSDWKKVFEQRDDSYTPLNNKLLTYPYNFITVLNPSGGNVILKFEQFEIPMGTVMFTLDTTLIQNPKFTLTPKNYKNESFVIEDSIECQGFGLCSWNNDNYSNWYANNSAGINAQSVNTRASYNVNNQIMSNTFGNTSKNADIAKFSNDLSSAISGFGAVTQAMSGNISGAIRGATNTSMSYLGGVLNKETTMNSAKTDLENGNLQNYNTYQNTMRSIMASITDASVQPNTCKGDTSASGLDVARGTNTFFVQQTMIKPEYARLIDGYFQMFGYQINTFGNPQQFTKTRSKWNYIKTVGCIIKSTIPHEDKRAIEELFDNGLTIWHSEANMFTYDVKNTII